MPTIDIDRDAAHEAAQRELSSPGYPKASLTDRLAEWLDELMYRLARTGSEVPGGWLTIAVLMALVIVAVVVAVRIARRAMRTDRGALPLFGGQELGAAEHRATAEQHAAAGQWGLAIRHRLRAVARQLEETGVLPAVPGRTATELARDAAAALPGLGAEFRDAADSFNDVTYGGQPGTESAYRLVAGLDDHVRTAGPAAGPTTGADQESASWVQVR